MSIMKRLKVLLITLLISLNTVLTVCPKIVFVKNSESVVTSCGNNFSILFIDLTLGAVVLSQLAYIVGEIVNQK